MTGQKEGIKGVGLRPATNISRTRKFWAGT